MKYSLSVWLDEKTAKALEWLCHEDERKRSDMVKVLIRRAARELSKEDASLKSSYQEEPKEIIK